MAFLNPKQPRFLKVIESFTVGEIPSISQLSGGIRAINWADNAWYRLDTSVVPNVVIRANGTSILDAEETDPEWTDSPSFGIDNEDIAAWNANLREAITPVNAVASQGTLTATAGGNKIVNGNTVSIGPSGSVKVYTFKTVLTPTEGEVLIGENDTAALLNLKNALNHTGTPDTDYKCAVAHLTAEGLSSNATTIIVESRIKGVIGNLIMISKSGADISWNGDGFLGATVLGVDGTIGYINQMATDSGFIYVCTATNTISDANWKKVAIA